MRRKPYFVFSDRNGVRRIKGALLARYVREHLNFLLVRNSGKTDIQIYVYENGVYRFCAVETFKGYIKNFIAQYDECLITMTVVNEAFNQLMTDLNYVKIEDLNADESIINFQNGILKLSDDKPVLLPHSPQYLSTIQIPCNYYEEEIPTPVFDSYINTLTGNNEKTRLLLLEFIGVIISNVKGWRMKKALFMFGPGDTGKSQLKSLCERMIGIENYSSADFNELEERFGTSALYGKRLAGSADASHMSVKELKTFKKLTGGDSIQAEFKGQKAFDFVFNGLLWLCMNSLPKFGGDNGPWVYERIMVIQCTNVIPKEKQDKQLLDKMYSERSGIVQKAIKALLKVISNGYRFDETNSVIQIRKQYMAENNSIISFFNECVIRRPNNRIDDSCTTSRMFNVYKSWCRDNSNGFSKTAKEFRDEICSILNGSFSDVTTKRNGYTYYTDYTLTLEAKKNYSGAYGYDSTTG